MGGVLAWQSSLFAGLPAGLFSGLFYLDCFAALAMTARRPALQTHIRIADEQQRQLSVMPDTAPTPVAAPTRRLDVSARCRT